MALMTAKSLRIHRAKGDTLEIFSPGGEAEAEVMGRVAKAMERGCAVTFPDGRKEWIDVNPYVDLTKSGSDQYTWHKDGERVLHTRERVTVKDGVSTRVALEDVWRKW